jgi:hypothetical protein
MTAEEYRNALRELGMSQLSAALAFCVSLRTSQNWAAEGVSGPAAIGIRLLMQMPSEGRKTALQDALNAEIVSKEK